MILQRTDTVERLENLLAVTRFISKSTPYMISVLECAPYCNELIKTLLSEEIDYNFIEAKDTILHRTQYINHMTKESTTKYIAIWDADIIIAPKQAYQVLEWIKSGEADFVIPYDKHALDTTPIIRKLFLEDGEIETLEQNRSKMKEMYAPNPLDGAFMANREAYIEAGMENEDFYGWGMEDGERFCRWQRLGYKIKRVPGPLYHLSHGRGVNSMFHTPDQGLWMFNF